MTAGNLATIANHLWQSTVFAGIAMLLALAFRKQRAVIRYWIWMAASLKFLIPFVALVDIGRQLPWKAAATAAPPGLTLAVQEIGRPFVTQPFASSSTVSVATDAVATNLPVIVFAFWTCGVAAVVFCWGREWHRTRRMIRVGTPLSLDESIRAVSVPARVEPGVAGIIRPVLLLPEGIVAQLSPAQLQAIVLHERCHIRRRDNLAAFLHMVVESVFWFHPLVWWIERRLLEERERACDEEVVRLTGDPQTYAEGILNVCRFYAGSPSTCVSRVTGAGLKKRIEEIVQHKLFEPLTTGGKLLLGTAGALAIAIPVLVGVASTPQVEAQSSQFGSPVAFEAASIKENKSTDARGTMLRFMPGGRFSATGVPLRWLIALAYGIPIQSIRLSTGPEFDAAVGAGRYDIEAVPPKGAFPAGATAAVENEIVRRMLQTLLAERFKLVIRRDTKELPVYAIVIGKNGAKLKTADVLEKDCKDDNTNPNGTPCHQFNGGRGRGLHGEAVTMTDVAQQVENWSDHPVVDRTGLKGLFNVQTTGWRPQEPIQLQPRPDGAPPNAEQLAFADPSTPTLFDVFEQLGLKLDPQKASVETILLVSIQRPTEN